MDTEHLTVAELMTPDPCGVDERLRLGDALDRMLANNIRHLVVLRDDRLAGIVALDDIHVTSSVLGGRAEDATIRTAMRPAFTCSPDTPVAEVARAMESGQCDCAVVLDADGATVIGIFTITDALRALRQLEEGHFVQPEHVPSHNRAPYEPKHGRPVVPVRAGTILSEHHAAPRATDASFGKTHPR
jgi:CBS domain-containing protein